MVDNLLDRNAICRYSWRTNFAAGVKIWRLTQVVLQCGIWVFPDAEEADSPANLLAPLAVIMGSQMKSARCTRFGASP